MLSKLERNGMLEIKVMGDSAEQRTYEVDQKVSSAGIVCNSPEKNTKSLYGKGSPPVHSLFLQAKWLLGL